jgi:hypothetical protein
MLKVSDVLRLIPQRLKPRGCDGCYGMAESHALIQVEHFSIVSSPAGCPFKPDVGLSGGNVAPGMNAFEEYGLQPVHRLSEMKGL